MRTMEKDRRTNTAIAGTNSPHTLCKIHATTAGQSGSSAALFVIRCHVLQPVVSTEKSIYHTNQPQNENKCPNCLLCSSPQSEDTKKGRKKRNENELLTEKENFMPRLKDILTMQSNSDFVCLFMGVCMCNTQYSEFCLYFHFSINTKDVKSRITLLSQLKCLF